MNGPHLAVCLAFALVLMIANGDHNRPPGRVVTGLAAERPASGAAMNRFEICGWQSPPNDSTDDARIAEMGEAGMRLLLPAVGDSGRLADNLRRLDLAAAHGMRCILWDSRFERVDPARPEGLALMDSIVADYRGHPAFFGYYLGDEPPREFFPGLGQWYAALRARDPEHSAWNNLLGRSAFKSRDEWLEYTRDFAERVQPAALCNDQYDFLVTGDRGHFVENAAGLAAVAREAGVPFWSFVLLIQHLAYRALTPGELKWQVSILLAYGARGVGYFTYWTPAPDSSMNWKYGIIGWDGRRSLWYAVVSGFNRRVRAAGETLAGLTWLATVHAGSVPAGGTGFVPDDWLSAVDGRAALGYFVDGAGTRYLLVANSDSLAARTVTLTLRDVAQACVLGEHQDSWDQVTCAPPDPESRLVLELDAGSFALVRLEGGSAGVIQGGKAPVMLVMPNPAGGEVRLELSRVAYGGRLEIIDAAGRRAWSRTLRPGNATLVWRGERDSGGQAPAGLYFARLEDERGVTVARIAWRGAR
jgi:hypothetical protein